MNVNPISTIQSFTAANRPKPADREATVKDLYDAEDRIIEAQKDLIRNQNARISNAMKALALLTLRAGRNDYSTQNIYTDTINKINQLQGNLA